MYFFRNVILSLTITLWLKGSFQEIDGGTGSVLSRPNGHLRPFHTFSLLQQPSLLSYLSGDSLTVLSALLFFLRTLFKACWSAPLPHSPRLRCWKAQEKTQLYFLFQNCLQSKIFELEWRSARKPCEICLWMTEFFHDLSRFFAW